MATSSAVVAFWATSALAQTWTGGGGDNNWSTSANWSGGVPSSTGVANVSLAGGTRTSPVLDSTYDINLLTFSSASSFTLQQNSGLNSRLGLEAGINVSGTGFAQVNAPVDISNAATFSATNGNLNVLKGVTVLSGDSLTVASSVGKVVTISGPLSMFSNAGITFNGPGNATLNASGGAAFSTSKFSVNGGTVSLTGAQSFGSATVGGTGTLRLTTSNEFTYALVSGGGTLEADVSQNMDTIDLNGGNFNGAGGTTTLSQFVVGALFGSSTSTSSGTVNAQAFGIYGPTVNNGTIYAGYAYNSSSFDNEGTVAMTGGSTLYNYAGATFLNNGQFAGVMDNMGTYKPVYGAFAGTYVHDGGTLDMSQAGGFYVTGGSIIINSPLTLLYQGYFGAGDTSSTVVNNSILNLNSSSLHGSLAGVTNNRVVNGGGELYAGNFTNVGVWNVTGETRLYQASFLNSGGTLNLPVGYGMDVDALSLISNSGTINMGGGAITLGGGSAGTVTNAAAGQIVGYGLIAIPLTQQGLLIPQGGTLNVTAPFTNLGIIRAQPGGMLAGGTVTNKGRIQGDGSIASPVVNAAGGHVEPTGTLAILYPLTNQVGGTIQVTPNNALVLSQGFVGNASSGLIILAGGELDANNYPLTNASTGQITGYGTLTTSGLRNSGSITFTGGTTIVNGPVTNDASKSLRIQYNPAIFTGMVQNNGNLYVTATTATFAGGYGGGAAQGAPPPGPPPVSSSSAVSGTGSLVIAPGGELISDGVVQANVVIQGSTGNPGQLVIPSREPTGRTPATGRAVGQSISIFGTLGMVTDPSGDFLSNVDLQDNDLILHNAAEPSVRYMIAAWYDGGAHDRFGLGSSLAGTGTGPDALATLGAAQNTDGQGGTLFGTFDGVSVSATDVLVKYTYIGDTNLDGIVDGSDLSNLFAGMNGGLAGWVNGDLNYDGVVSAADLSLLVNSLAREGASFGISGGIGGAVPEPASLTPVLTLACALGRRRHTSRR